MKSRDPPGGIAAEKRFRVTVAGKPLRFVGSVGADLASVRRVWRKIFGGCLATTSPGSVRIVADRTVLATNNNSIRSLQ